MKAELFFGQGWANHANVNRNNMVWQNKWGLEKKPSLQNDPEHGIQAEQMKK